MSVINFTDNESVTMVQGVGGLFFCRETWMSRKSDSPTEETK